VVTWFKVYAVGMAMLYVLVVGAGVACIVFADQMADRETSATEWRVQGVMFAAVGIPIAGAFVLGALLPARPWVWIYDFVLIAIGLTSCALLPATIPLLIYWVKPATKVWFGRNP
jgi:hypothetical protein